MKKSLMFLGLFGVVFLQNKLEAVPVMMEFRKAIEHWTPAEWAAHELFWRELYQAQQHLTAKITMAKNAGDMKEVKRFFDEGHKKGFFVGTFEEIFFSTIMYTESIKVSQAKKMIDFAGNAEVIRLKGLNLANFILNGGYAQDLQKLSVVTQQLINKGALVNCLTDEAMRERGETPLSAMIWASESPKALTTMISLLLKNRANPNLKTSQGRTPLDTVNYELQHGKLPVVWTVALEKVAEMLKAAGGK